MILINPSIHPQAQSPLMTPFIYNTFPTSLGFLGGYLRKYNKITPNIVDEGIGAIDIEKLNELLKINNDVKVVGLTLLTINAHRAFQLSRLVKELDSDYLVVAGGIHATVLPDECLDNSEVDIVVRGEGEKTLSEIVECIKSDEDYYDREGISYKKNGTNVHNPDRKLIDIEKIPPFPYDLFDETFESYRDFGTVISSRGCPFDCTFCSQRAISGRRYRHLSVQRVLDEVELLVNKYNQTNIWFMDDNFLVKKERAFSLLGGIIKRGLHKKAGFIAEMRGESVNYEVLNKMKEANFQMVSIGMETGSQRLLDTLEKGEKVDDNVNAIKMANEVGISSSATFIFGLPTETREERLATARLARKIPLTDARFNVAVPYPGTKLFQIAKKESRLLIKKGWSNFNVQFYMFGDDIPYVPENTSKYLLMYDTFMANLRFNLRIKTLISFFISPVSGGMVLTLPEKWYIPSKELINCFRLGFYIFKRFLKLSFKACLAR